MLSAAFIALFLQAAATPPAPQRATPADAPPPTEIFLASLEPATDGTIRIGAPENITKAPGYDNQPYFTAGGDELLFTANRDGKQTDVYSYRISTRALKQLTKTNESEYSPTPMSDGRFSVIRVEADGTQRLWAFSANGDNPTLLLPDVQPVGYHAWADPETVVVFVLGDSPTLQIANVKTGKAETVAERVGRCIARTPDGRISFVQKTAAKGPWQIVDLDVATRKMTPITDAVEGSEDYAWLPDGRLLMASGSKIFLWGKDSRVKVWQEVADLTSARIQNITRLAVSPNGKRLAIVAETATKR